MYIYTCQVSLFSVHSVTIVSMDKLNPTRRKVLKDALLLIAGGAMNIQSAEAKKEPLGTHIPSLSSAELFSQKEKATEQLVESFWDNTEIRNHVLKSFFKNESDEPLSKQDVQKMLALESLMYIPSNDEISSLEMHKKKIAELSSILEIGKYGVFILGDTQRMYLVKRITKDSLQFIKAYPVSTSREDWSTQSNSSGTPLGVHRIKRKTKGMLGEVVSATNKYADSFVQIPTFHNGKKNEHTFVRSLTSGTDTVAEIVTGSFLLSGKSTPVERGIQIHGTNRTNRLGVPGSGGCIRVSNVDIYDLFNYLDNDTPVVIHATMSPLQIASQTTDRTGKKGFTVPAPWQPADTDEKFSWGPSLHRKK